MRARFGAKLKEDEIRSRAARTGNTDAERFDNAVRNMFSVSKADFLKAEEHYQRTKPPKKRDAKKRE